LKKSAIFLFLFILSCANRTVEIDLSTINLPIVLEKARKAEESVKSVKGLALVRIKSPERNLAFNQVTIAKEPNFLRLEALAPFGRTAAMIISDGATVYVITPDEQEAFDALREFDFSFFYPELPVRITVTGLVNLLLGRLPEMPEYDASQVQISKGSSNIILVFLDENGRQNSLWVNPFTYRVEKAKIALDDGTVATCRFKNFKEVANGVSFPTRVELKVKEFSISINYRDEVEVNRNIEENLFNQAPSLVGFEKKF